MATKLKVRPVEEAQECPFYVANTRNKSVCVWKQITTANAVMAMTEDNPSYDPDIWNTDCGGTYSQCSFIPLFYNMATGTEAEAEDKAETPYIYSNSAIDTYDPFADDDGEEPVPVAVESPAPNQLPAKAEQSKPVEPRQPKKEVGTTKEIKNNHDVLSSCRVSMHQVANPYSVKTDVLLCPSNSLLAVDDPLMSRMSHGQVQEECDRIALAHENAGRHISMGQIYVTSNGGEHQGGIQARAIYHGVVLSPMRVINETDIAKAVHRALVKADVGGAKVVTMLPFDCGTLDINQAALIQLSAIYKYLRGTPKTSLTNVFIVMEDLPSLTAFKTAYQRVFKP